MREVPKTVQRRYKKKILEEAYNKLLDGGYVRNEPYGPPSKNAAKLIAVKELEEAPTFSL